MVTYRTVPVNVHTVSDDRVLSNRYLEKVKILYYPIYTSITYLEGVQILFWNNWKLLSLKKLLLWSLLGQFQSIFMQSVMIESSPIGI